MALGSCGSDSSGAVAADADAAAADAAAAAAAAPAAVALCMGPAGVASSSRSSSPKKLRRKTRSNHTVDKTFHLENFIKLCYFFFLL